MIVQRPLQHNIFDNQRLMTMAMNQTPHTQKSVQPELETYTILIADDDRSMADLLATNLRRLGHRVIGMAANGRQAVEMHQKLRPGLVMMDIEMPIMTGLQAAREILGSHSVPIVLSTGMSDVSSITAAVDLKVISYLVKPFSPAQLKVALHIAVARCRDTVQAPPAPQASAVAS